jgi:anti-anti-sigma regulatory factor
MLNVNFNQMDLKVDSLIESVKDYIIKNDCNFMSVDISNLHLMDAMKATVICSTYHFAKYPTGKISWISTNKELKNIIKPLNLGNTEIIPG